MPRAGPRSREVVDAARAAGLLVIADAKRGDIDVTAAAYAQAFFGATPTPFGEVPGLGADALTVNPLLGSDSLAPLIAAARPRGGGLFVLARTSNPGAADVQELELLHGGHRQRAVGRADRGRGRGRHRQRRALRCRRRRRRDGPGRLERMRELMPHAVFLLPGVGAQGGRVEDLAAAFAPGPAGGLIAASRGIVFAHEHGGGDPESSARSEAARLRELAWSLRA